MPTAKYRHIIVYNIKEKTYTDVTPGAYYSPVFSPSGPEGFVFSPDSKELCYLSNHDKHPEASTNCDSWIVPVTGGEARNITGDNKAWDGSPQYSPDGRYIAYRFQRAGLRERPHRARPLRPADGTEACAHRAV